MNVHVSVSQEDEIKIGLESEIIQVEGTVSGDYIPVPSIAEVGQTIVVKAVDDKGKPTEWEAADVPSGSGRKETAVLADFELSEDITNYGTIVIPLSENPFDFSEILVMIPASIKAIYVVRTEELPNCSI